MDKTIERKDLDLTVRELQNAVSSRRRLGTDDPPPDPDPITVECWPCFFGARRAR